MIDNTFEAALAALKQGEFVRHSAWGNAFLVMLAPRSIPTESIGSEALREIVTRAGLEDNQLVDLGNIRLIDLDKGTVTNGWLPSAWAMMTDGWMIYDAYVAQLQSAMAGKGGADLVTVISSQLQEFGVPCIGKFSPGDINAQLMLGGDYAGVTVTPCDALYSVACRHVEHRGSGDLRAEIEAMRRLLAGNPVSRRFFYKTVSELEVLSEEPINPEADMDTVIEEAYKGDYVGRWNTKAVFEMSAPKVVEELSKVGSEPGFFQLNDDASDYMGETTETSAGTPE